MYNMISFLYGVISSMSKRKNIKNITVEYYKVYSYTDRYNDPKTSVYSELEISNLLEKLQNVDIKKRTIEYNGENVILSTIEYNKDLELWELVFFKSRSSTIPYIVNENGRSREFELDSGEMISEVLCVEYNPKTKIIAMQRNAYAFGTRCLETFLSSFLENPLYLESIQKIGKEKRTLFKNNKLKKLKIRVKNVAPKGKKKGVNKPIKQYNKDTSICKVIDSALAINSSIINIEFSVGNSSHTIDMKDEDYEVFQDLMNNNDVKCLEVGLAPDEHSTMQITDFMDFRVHDIVSVPFTKGHQIDISDILKKMAEKFKENIYLQEENR